MNGPNRPEVEKARDDVLHLCNEFLDADPPYSQEEYITAFMFISKQALHVLEEIEFLEAFVKQDAGITLDNTMFDERQLELMKHIMFILKNIIRRERELGYQGPSLEIE